MINRFAIIMIIIATSFFFISSHNIDNAWNMQYLEEVHGMKLIDESYLSSYDKVQLYKNGMMMNFGSFLLAVLGALFVNFQSKHSLKKEEIDKMSKVYT